MTSGLLTRTLRLIGVAAFCSTSVVPSVSAEPVTVTSGQFALVWDDPRWFQFFGAGGFLLGSLPVEIPSSPQHSCMSGCAPGTALDLSAVAGEDLGSVTFAVVDGTDFLSSEDRLRLTGTFSFDSQTVMLPPVAVVGAVYEFSAPFVFSGFATAFPRDASGTVPLFNVALTGRGTVSLEMETYLGTYSDPTVRYRFESDVAPVPEPTTMGLFGTGLIGLAARAWRRKRTGQKPEQVPGSDPSRI